MSIYTFGNPRVGDAALAEDTDAATRECEGPFRCIVEVRRPFSHSLVHSLARLLHHRLPPRQDDVVARLPRGKQANRIYDYRHAGTTALLEGGSVRLAKADGEDCPLAEVDPLYEGVFPPILNFGALRRSNLAEFVRAEATKTDEACAYSLPSHPHIPSGPPPFAGRGDRAPRARPPRGRASEQELPRRAEQVGRRGVIELR